jgi:predicted dehydrogenase
MSQAKLVGLLRTESGALVQINNSRRAVYGYDQRVEAFGSAGMLRAENRRETTLEHSSADFTRLGKIPYSSSVTQNFSPPSSTTSSPWSRAERILDQRFRNSNHIRQPYRAYRPTCEPRGPD